MADRLVARYEYDPYGRIMNQAGFYAAANPFRWSTKRFDPETGSPQRISPQAELSDFGLRYYSATLGRWINRDPIGDFGGANVYAYVGNNATNRTDYLGLASASCTGPNCGGAEPWSPEPTAVEENDRRPCPHAGSRPDGSLGRLPEWNVDEIIRLVEELSREREREERRQLAIFLHGFEDRLFGSQDLLLAWIQAYKAIHGHNARFREIFQHFVDAWADAYLQALAADPYAFSSTWVHGVAREGWRVVHDDETLATMSDAQATTEAVGASAVLGAGGYYGVTYAIAYASGTAGTASIGYTGGSFVVTGTGYAGWATNFGGAVWGGYSTPGFWVSLTGIPVRFAPAITTANSASNCFWGALQALWNAL